MVYKKLLLLLCFCSHQVLAADCGSVSGTTTISTNCTSLNIIGDDSKLYDYRPEYIHRRLSASVTIILPELLDFVTERT